jgi:osmotically-inducible protein OsmY
MNKFCRLGAALVLGASMLTSLSGCFGLAVGSAVMAGMAASDRRTLGAQTEDSAIGVKSEVRVGKLVGDEGHVNITSFNRRALLTGEVKDDATRAAVAREVAAIEGVLSVTNELTIAGPSSYTARSNDTLITGRVKAALVDTKDIFANSFKITTEQGVVFLMGRVTQREGDLATEAVRSVSGVQKVVKVFEYISEGELQQLTPAPAQNLATPPAQP